MTVPSTSVTSLEPDRIEARIARVLSLGAILAVVLLLIGIALMLLTGTSPDAAVYPSFDAGRLVGDILSGRPEGFLWAGILVVIATPIIRVTGELLGFAVRGDRIMAAVAGVILLVVALSVAIAIVVEG